MTPDEARTILGLPEHTHARHLLLTYLRAVRRSETAPASELRALQSAFWRLKGDPDNPTNFEVFGTTTNMPLMMWTLSQGERFMEAIEYAESFDEEGAIDEESLAALHRGAAEGRPGFLEILAEFHQDHLTDDELRQLEHTGGVLGPIYAAKIWLKRGGYRVIPCLLRSLDVTHEDLRFDHPDPVWVTLAIRKIEPFSRSEDADALRTALRDRLDLLIELLEERPA